MASDVTELKIRFGRHLAEYRKRRRLTQDELASAAQVSIDTVKRLETGRLGASFDVVVRLADALGVDAADLFAAEQGGSRPVLDRLVFDLSAMADDELAWFADLFEVARRRL
jgi:transcriptional regulator with XRE-family HTH domain